MDKRIANYNTFVLYAIVFSVPLIILGLNRYINDSILFFVLICFILIIIGTFHNFLYYGKLDAYQIGRNSVNFTPAIVFFLITLASFLLAYNLKFLSPLFDDAWAPFTFLLVITSILGFISFTIPIRMQMRFLELDSKKTAYDNVYGQLDSRLESIAHDLLDEDKNLTTTEVAENLLRVEKALRGFFLVSYREVLESYHKPNYFQFISPFIGPVFSLIIFVVDKFVLN